MISTSKLLGRLVISIALLSVVAAGVGVFWRGDAPHYTVTSLRGESVSIQGSGLYQYDSVSSASQAIAQDVVTLILGVPLLLVALWFYRKGSLRGQLLLCGTLAYFLYTYISYAMLVAFNSLFLLYVALVSLSLVAFILSVTGIDIQNLPFHFTNRFPRKFIVGFLFVLASFLMLAWLGRIVPAMFSSKPPVGLETSTTLVIQVLDLGLLVPLSYSAGILLLRKLAWGYLLASVVLFKGLTIGTAICALIIGQILAGVEISPVEAVVFPLITLTGLILTLALLRSLSQEVASEVNTKQAELILQK